MNKQITFFLTLFFSCFVFPSDRQMVTAHNNVLAATVMKNTRNKPCENRIYFGNIHGGLLIGVFGGKDGPLVADYARKRFPILFEEQAKNNTINQQLFTNIFSQINSETQNYLDSSTANVAYIKNETLHIASIGTRMLCWKDNEGYVNSYCGPLDYLGKREKNAISLCYDELPLHDKSEYLSMSDVFQVNNYYKVSIFKATNSLRTKNEEFTQYIAPYACDVACITVDLQHLLDNPQALSLDDNIGITALYTQFSNNPLFAISYKQIFLNEVKKHPYASFALTVAMLAGIYCMLRR